MLSTKTAAKRRNKKDASTWGQLRCLPSALHRAGRCLERAPPAAVVLQSCRLGYLVSLALPVVAIAVLLLWENATDRPDLGVGGLMLYSLPWVAVGAALVLVLVFGLVSRFAAHRT